MARADIIRHLGNEESQVSPTECIVDLDKLTLVCWFGFTRLQPVSDNNTAGSEIQYLLKK